MHFLNKYNFQTIHRLRCVIDQLLIIVLCLLRRFKIMCKWAYIQLPPHKKNNNNNEFSTDRGCFGEVWGIFLDDFCGMLLGHVWEDFGWMFTGVYSSEEGFWRLTNLE